MGRGGRRRDPVVVSEDWFRLVGTTGRRPSWAVFAPPLPISPAGRPPFRHGESTGSLGRNHRETAIVGGLRAAAADQPRRAPPPSPMAPAVPGRARRRRRDHNDEPAMIAPMMAPIVSPRRNDAVDRSSSPAVTSAAPRVRGSRPSTRSRSRSRPRSTPPAGGSRRSTRTSNPRRSASASPAQAPRIAASDDDRQAPAGAAPDEHEERGVEDPDEDGQDERRAEAHRPTPHATRPPIEDGERLIAIGGWDGRSARHRARRRRRTGRRPGRAPRPRPARPSRPSSARRAPARSATPAARWPRSASHDGGSGPRRGTPRRRPAHRPRRR